MNNELHCAFPQFLVPETSGYSHGRQGERREHLSVLCCRLSHSIWIPAAAGYFWFPARPARAGNVQENPCSISTATRPPAGPPLRTQASSAVLPNRWRPCACSENPSARLWRGRPGRSLLHREPGVHFSAGTPCLAGLPCVPPRPPYICPSSYVSSALKPPFAHSKPTANQQRR